MNPYPAPELNDNAFTIGTTLFPITPLTTNSALQDIDPVLYYLIDFYSAVIKYNVGARFQNELARLGAIFTNNPDGYAIGSVYPVNIVPYLQDDSCVFPMLGVWRGDFAASEKDISTAKMDTTVHLLYVMSPLRLAHIETFRPIIEGISKSLWNATENGHSVGYNDGYTIATLAGYSSIGIVRGENLQINVPGLSTNLPFESFHLELKLEEINTIIEPSNYPQASLDLTTEYPYPNPIVTFTDNL